MQRPDLPAAIFAAATETLALWLARGWSAVADDVLAWSESHWRAAEWVAYWQGAIPRWIERLDEQDPTSMVSLSNHAACESERVLRQAQDAIPLLREVATQSHARTARMLDAAQEMIVGLRARGIELAPLKGARLAPFYYQPSSLRSMGDLDVLVRPADVPRACDWLEAHGYTFYSRSEEDVVYLRGARRPDMWHPDNVLPVELHFRLREEFGGAGLTWDLSDEVWHNATRAPYLQTETNLVAPVVLLRHLCAHTSSDIFIRRGKIQQLEDIAHVARTFAPTDWQSFVSGVPAHCARFVYPALALTAHYYDGVIAPAALDALRANVKPKLHTWVDGLTLAAASESNLESRSGIGVPLARLLAASPSETARALTTSLLPPRWNLMKRYPRLAASPFFPLCYLLLNADRAWHIGVSSVKYQVSRNRRDLKSRA